MSIPESVIDAALDDGPYITCFYSASLLEVWGPVGDNTELLETLPKAKEQSMCERLNAESCARRVILALAENLPESAVEKAAFSICQSGKFENGEGRCAMICMDSLGNKPKQCVHALRVHGELTRSALVAALKDVVED